MKETLKAIISKRLSVRVALTLGLVAAALAAMSVAAEARTGATFTVDLVVDAADLDPNDGLCDASPERGARCTLRAAIQEANASPGRDKIRFDIPGSGVKTIRPASPLPNITDEVTIDGYTQLGASENTKAKGTNAALRIELDGTDAGESSTGLSIEAPNSLVRGLVVDGFVRNVEIFGAAQGSRIQGCFLGTDPTGTAARGGNLGVNVDTVRAVVGGTTPAARNLISGNTGSGVILFRTEGSRVVGNLIGTKRDGTSPLGNGASGVFIQASSNNFVGGNITGAGNIIAFNGFDGVSVSNEGNGNRILRNSIFANTGIGIDLQTTISTDGPTANDPGDADTGANDLQNFPALTSATTGSGDSVTVSGELDSTPNETFAIRFFSSPSGDEGRRFLAQRSVSTNANGNTGTFTFDFVRSVSAGQKITATATGAGSTSEFSAPRTVEAQQ